LTALALFAAFMETAGITSIDIANPKVMAGFIPRWYVAIPVLFIWRWVLLDVQRWI
jgi:hypothetical protein